MRFYIFTYLNSFGLRNPIRSLLETKIDSPFLITHSTDYSGIGFHVFFKYSDHLVLYIMSNDTITYL